MERQKDYFYVAVHKPGAQSVDNGHQLLRTNPSVSPIQAIALRSHISKHL